MNINRNLCEVRDRIEKAALKSGRRGCDITLVAVSKTVDEEAVRQAWELGVKDFGENRVQELIKKSNALPEAHWHFIGRLQTNKVKDVVNRAYLIHSLDRWQLAYELDKRAGQENKQVEALIQVNITGENSKTGFAAAEVVDFLAACSEFNYLQIRGLMTMAIEDENPENSRAVFRELNELCQRMKRKNPQVKLDYLSMGMSQDYEVAIEEGANIVRIGSALFK
jgi:pyridoxal phosphate enzyme (YggS family)